jgi:hypothetical protein
MKVKSKLADVDFQFGPIERQQSTLVISSHPSQPMQSKVYVTPDDVLRFLGRFLASPSAIVFALGFPYFWWRSRGEEKAAAAKPRDPW